MNTLSQTKAKANPNNTIAVDEVKVSQIKAGEVLNLVMDLFGRIDSDVRLE